MGVSQSRLQWWQALQMTFSEACAWHVLGAISAPCGTFSPAGGPSLIQLGHACSCHCGGLAAASIDGKMPAPLAKDVACRSH